MAHITENKQIVMRIRRIKGQLEAVEKGILEQKECFTILQTLSACRGAMNGLMGELVEEHIQTHVINAPSDDASAKNQAADDLIKLLKTYWK